MAELLTIESLIALLTLAALEIVLGIDNIVFIAINHRPGSIRRSKAGRAKSACLPQWACVSCCCCA